MSATGKADQHEAERGFTLIEMLVVLAVAGLVSGIAFPAVDRAVSQQQYRAALGQVGAALHDARSTAIAQSSATRFVVRPDRRTIVVAGKEVPPLAPGILVDAPTSGITFYDDGSATAATVSLSKGARQDRFIVDAATGQIREGR